MKPLLLLAEGDEELRDLYWRFLTARGYEVAVAANGLDCVEKLTELHPHVLILDLELSWGGGDGVLSWLREERSMPSVPVVLTATAGAPQLFLELGAPPVVECLAKPFALTTLLHGVRSALTCDPLVSGFGGPHRAPSEIFVG